MADDQQPPLAPSGRAGSSLPGATPPTVAWTDPPAFDPAGAPSGRIPDSGVNWPGRRSLSTTERVLFCLGAVLLAGYVGLAVGTADWAAHPVLAGLAGLVGIAAAAGLVASAWARRPNRSMITGSALRGLDRPTRRALVRELRAGRPGPPELRLYAARWTCQQLQAPWNPPILLALLASNAAIATGGPIVPSRVLLLVLLLALNVVSSVPRMLSTPGARRVADALDELAPPPPQRAPSSGDAS